MLIIFEIKTELKTISNEKYFLRKKNATINFLHNAYKLNC